MTPEELYEKLQSPVYDKYPCHRGGDLGDGMSVIEEVQANYWRQFYLLNNAEKKAYRLLDGNLTLTFVTDKDVVWEDVEKLSESYRAYKFSAYYPPFRVGRFTNGVSAVKWTIYPDGMYFMDSDGYGMKDNDEIALFGFIDRQARVVIPFRYVSYKGIEEYRPEAERIAAQLAGKLQSNGED